MAKKAFILTLVAVLVLLSACSGGGSGGEASNPPEGGAANEAETNEAEAEPAPEAADPLGKYAEPVKMTIGMCVDPTDKTLPAGDAIDNNVFTRAIKDALNIEVSAYWTVSCGENRNQKVSLAIASNDLPDAMVVTPVELRQMAEAGQLESMQEAFDAYASDGYRSVIDSTEGLALEAVSFDGQMLALPNTVSRSDGTHLMWIRQDWLDKLGLAPPQTIDELERVATAFSEQDPDGNGQDDTFGISGPDVSDDLFSTFLESTNNVYGFDPIFSAFDAYPGFWIEGADGQPVYGSTLPEMKDALAKLRDWYARGLIDPEMGVREESAEPVTAGKSGIFFGMWWAGFNPIPNALAENPNANWQAYALPLNAEGVFKPRINTPSTQFVVVRKGYEHPEAAMKILNFLYYNEDRLEAESGVHTSNIPLRITMDRYDKFEGEVTLLRKVLLDGESTDILKPENQNYNPTLMAEYENILKVKNEPYDDNDIATWNVAAEGGQFPRAYARLVGAGALLSPMERVNSMLYSQTRSMEDRWTNLEKLESETFMKIIMGVEPVDSFDAFVEEWKSQGGDRIAQEVAEAVQ